MDVIVTGYVGLEGTAILANEKRTELETRFSKAFIDKSAAYIDHISAAMEAASAIGAGVAAIHDASQGRHLWSTLGYGRGFGELVLTSI